MNADTVREIKLSLADPIQVCDKLGLLGGRGSFTRQGGGVLIRCPVHDDRTPSCSVQVRSSVLLWKCHACDASGDVLTLVAATRGLTMAGDDFRQVLIIAAELAGLHSLVAELESGERRERPEPVARPEPTPEPERPYPPTRELEAFWEACGALGEPERAWCDGRGLDAELVGEIVRGLPVDGDLPRWVRYQGRSWRETGHRIVVPVYDSTGEMRSVRAIRVTDGESPKRLPPSGFKAAGLVMADEFGVAMLRGTYAPKRVLILEGEPDFISSVTTPTTHIYARIGITSGSWSAAFAARLPRGTKVFLATHDDAAGEKYAQAIEQTLTTQQALRWRIGVAA